MNGQEHPYDMPTFIMTTLNKSTLTFADPMATTRHNKGWDRLLIIWVETPNLRGEIFCPTTNFYNQLCGSFKTSNGRKQP